MMFSKLVFIVSLLFSVCVCAQELPTNFHEHDGLMKGAVPGFTKKKKSKFDPVSAKRQILSLYKDKGVRLIISLDHCKDVRKVIAVINTENVDFYLNHACRKIRSGKSQFSRNIELFRYISSKIGKTRTFVHCRYGAHRAVTAVTGAWIDRRGVPFDEAFVLSGGKLRSFRSPGQVALLGHARRYARMDPLAGECRVD